MSTNSYCVNPKTVNTRIISGMLFCWEEKANQTQDEKTASCNSNLFCRLRFLISYLIGCRTIKLSKSNQSVHGFWICTVITYHIAKLDIVIFLVLTALDVFTLILVVLAVYRACVT